MTDSQFKAKKWLTRYRRLHRQVEADQKLLEALEAVVNKCVARYENDGSGGCDVETSMKRKEDALLNYSSLKAKVESEERVLVKETNRVVSVIQKLSDPDHKAIATNLYIRNLKWEECMKEENISKSTLDRKHRDMLEKVAEILRNGGA